MKLYLKAMGNLVGRPAVVSFILSAPPRS